MKYRNFVFTHNNYVGTGIQDTLECRFIAYSKEVAPSTGTPHLQGYVCFNGPCTLGAVVKKLPGCHVEPMLGSIADNDGYISKLTNPVERGDKPLTNDNKGRAEKLRWQRAKEAAIAGEFDKIDADIFIRQYGNLKRIRTDYQCKPVALTTSSPGVWIHGPTRTGKSHSVHTAYPGAYLKGNHRWWDGYAGEDVVYLEDFSVFDKSLGNLLKRWADKWPFDAEVKGGRMMIRPKKIVITSNYKIEEIFDDDITRDCLNQRFKVIEKLSKEQNIFF